MSSQSSPSQSSPPPSPLSSDRNRIPRTLYRQLVRWCREPDIQNVPLGSLLPPIYMRSPDQVDPRRMELLAAMRKAAKAAATTTTNAGKAGGEEEEDPIVRRAYGLLPSTAELKPNSMTVPIHSAQSLLSFFRAIFRLNSSSSRETEGDPTPQHQKERVSVAFDALKSLNELSSSGGSGSGGRGAVDRIRRRREAHLNRDGVRFRIGQVVQHRQERWRGVVAGWDRSDSVNVSSGSGSTAGNATKVPAGSLSEEFGKRTSLTMKDYSEMASVKNEVRYDIIVDEGDLHMMQGDSNWMSVADDGNNLDPVMYTGLMRIRNHQVVEYFDRFDRRTCAFVPNELKAYKYPLDVITDEGVHVRAASGPRVTDEERELCDGVVDAVREFARRLDQIIVNEAAISEKQFGLLANTRSRLAGLIEGDILPVRYKLSLDLCPSVSAAQHVRGLHNLCLEIIDVMSSRRTSVDNRPSIKFQLGDIVHHKMYGFRGVVVAWDPKPTVDVTRWDGLQHIDDPMELPFYHVIPDQGDCIEAFGGPRPMRYVCEDNLEMCPGNRRLVEVDLDDEWQRSPSGDSYVPPDELRFKFGELLDDDGVTERCMVRMEEAINSWQLDARLMRNTDDPVTSKLNLATMQELLQIVDSVGDAIAIEDMIKEMRKAHSDLGLRWLLDSGTTALMRGKAEEALAAYHGAIDLDAKYPEAHNKLATCLFMVGRNEESLMHTKKVLELDPTNFQALNGLGLIYYQQGKYEEAIDRFQESTAIDPWSPVSAKLSKSMDLLNLTEERYKP